MITSCLGGVLLNIQCKICGKQIHYSSDPSKTLPDEIMAAFKISGTPLAKIRRYSVALGTFHCIGDYHSPTRMLFPG